MDIVPEKIMTDNIRKIGLLSKNIKNPQWKLNP
jgi:hypothetical protein